MLSIGLARVSAPDHLEMLRHVNMLHMKASPDYKHISNPVWPHRGLREEREDFMFG